MIAKVAKPKGILNPLAGEQKFQLARYWPAPDLAALIEHYWLIDWDLRGQPPFVQETLPYPSVHVVFEQGNSQIFGIMRGKHSALLKEKGGVFGIKFRPGAFYPFIQQPVSDLTDKAWPVTKLFGEEALGLEATIFATEDKSIKIAAVESFLRQHLPPWDEMVAVADAMVARIEQDRTIIKVDDLLGQTTFTKRTLQRLFHQYIGVSPKWVIQRYRLHEAADQLASGSPKDCIQLAQELGYFDQAHFIKDFKTIIGKTPAEYLTLCKTEAVNSRT